MLYRLKQFYYALFPRISDNEIKWLDGFLSPEKSKLFFSQSLTEQRHSLDVAYEIQKYYNILDQKDYEKLLFAALFHDCGKSLTEIYLWQRIFMVLYKKLPIPLQYILAKNTAISETVRIFSNHASWGKHLAAKAGFDEDIQILILNHHTPVSPLDKILSKADCRH